MLAVTYRGKGRVRGEKKRDPVIEHPNDIVLKVTRTAICGSDLLLFHGIVPDTRVGCTSGHEFAGVVEEVGPSVASLSRGDRVVVPFNIACGTCFFCLRGQTSACENTPDDMSEEDVLFLSDILPTGYQAAEMGSIKAGDTVVAFGCGSPSGW